MTPSEIEKQIRDSSQEIESNPNNAQAWFSLGFAFGLKGFNIKALECFNKAISIKPGTRPIPFWWSPGVPYAARAEVYCSLGDRSLAFEDANQAVNLDPKYFYGWHVRGYLNLMKGNPTRAIEDLTQAILLFPDSIPSYAMRAEALGQTGQMERSMEDADKVLHFNQKDYKTWFVRGNAFLSLGNYEKAISDFLNSIKYNPFLGTEKNSKILENRQKKESFSSRACAFCLRGLIRCHYFHDDLGAEKDCDEAILHDPNYGHAYIVRAHAKRHLGKMENALTDHCKAIQLLPDDPYAFLTRGQAFTRFGLLDEAFQDYSEAIRLNNTWSAAYMCRGTVLLEKGNFQEAIQDYNLAILLDPENPKLYEKRSKAFLLIGEEILSKRDKVSAEEIKKRIREK